MTNISTGTGSVGVGGVVATVGFTAAAGSVDAAGVAGPLLVGEVADGSGAVMGAVGVFDDGDSADGLFNEVLTAFAVDMGGTAQPAGPVASGAEIAAKFTTPTTVSGWVDNTDTVRVVTIEANDRRGQAQGGNTMQGTPLQSASSAAGVAAVAGVGGGGLDRLVNVGLEVSVEIGRTRVTLADVLGFDVGSTIELDRAAGAPVDIRVNDTLLAQGEVVLVDDEYAVRITAIVDPASHQQQ